MKFKLQLFILLNLITLFCANNVANNGEFVDNTITKAHTTKERYVSAANELLQDVASAAHDAKDKIAEVAVTITDKAKDGFDAAKQTAKNVAGATKDIALQAKDKTTAGAEIALQKVDNVAHNAKRKVYEKTGEVVIDAVADKYINEPINKIKDQFKDTKHEVSDIKSQLIEYFNKHRQEIAAAALAAALLLGTFYYTSSQK